MSFALRSAKGTELLTSQSAALTDASQNASRRYTAVAKFPLKSLSGQKFKVAAQVEGTRNAIEREFTATTTGLDSK